MRASSRSGPRLMSWVIGGLGSEWKGEERALEGQAPRGLPKMSEWRALQTGHKSSEASCQRLFNGAANCLPYQVLGTSVSVNKFHNPV